jgi:thymidylate synthase
MVKEIHVYIEGGAKGQDRAASADLRRGFSMFLTKLCPDIRAKSIKLNTVIVGSTELTCKIFAQENENSPDKFFILLVDSDVFVDKADEAKIFLQNNPKLKKCDLSDVEENQCHLMVQVMETWFLADAEALKNHFGKDLKENKLRKNKKVEEIAKDDVLDSLKEATKTRKIGAYHKIKDGAKLLENIMPHKVIEAAPHCEKLFNAIKKAVE